MTTLQFTVLGVPVTQGSMRAFIPKGWDRPIVTHDRRKELGAWRSAVAASAHRAATRAGWSVATSLPVSLRLTFRLLAPKARPKTIRTAGQAAEWLFPIRNPDLDKMVRPILDALIGVLFRDDAQVVALDVRKVYAGSAGVDAHVDLLVNGPDNGSDNLSIAQHFRSPAARPAHREPPAAGVTTVRSSRRRTPG